MPTDALSELGPGLGVLEGQDGQPRASFGDWRVGKRSWVLVYWGHPTGSDLPLWQLLQGDQPPALSCSVRPFLLSNPLSIPPAHLLHFYVFFFLLVDVKNLLLWKISSNTIIGEITVFKTTVLTFILLAPDSCS